MAIARVAIDRVGEAAHVTVRLNTEDHAAIAAAHDRAGPATTSPSSPTRGCHGAAAASNRTLGNIDAGIDAQLQQMTQALLQEAPVRVMAEHQ